MATIKKMKIRLLFSFAIGLLAFNLLPVKWYVKANYYGFDNNDFVLSGFPFPYVVDSGIVGSFGNSFDTSINFVNFVVDILFYWSVFFGLTYVRSKTFTSPTKGITITS